jgi:hypothetical protein
MKWWDGAGSALSSGIGGNWVIPVFLSFFELSFVNSEEGQLGVSFAI